LWLAATPERLRVQSAQGPDPARHADSLLREDVRGARRQTPADENALAGGFIVTFLLRVADAVELKTVGQARGARVR
jgi:hypothetical protein